MNITYLGQEDFLNSHIIALSVDDEIWEFRVTSPVFIKRFKIRLKYSNAEAFKYLQRVGKLIRMGGKVMEEEIERTMEVEENNPENYQPLYQFFIAGVQHHKINSVLHDMSEGTVLSLVAEPTNRFDPNAIRIEYIDMDGDGTMLGYVPKKISSEVSARIAIGKSLTCKVIFLNKIAKPWEMCKVEIGEVLDV